MAQALLKPHVQQFLDFTTGSNPVGLNVGIEQVRVSVKSVFADRPLEEMQVRRDLGVIVLAIRRASGDMQFNPPTETKITGGDHLIAMGEPEGLRKLEQLLTGAGE